MPVYNVADYIEQCLQSILGQTFRDFELILVDDCSTDNSMDIVHEMLSNEGYIATKASHESDARNAFSNENFARKVEGHEVVSVSDSSASAIRQRECFVSASASSVMILHHDRNRGLSAARNTGMSVAKGEYVLFVDSDDYLSSDCLEKLYAKAKETGADVTYGGYDRVYDHPTEDKEISAQSVPSVGNYVMAWNKLCRRSFLQDNQISFIEGLIHEDNPWSFELTVTKAKFASVSDVTYHYRIRENSLQTHTNYQRHFNAYCRILQAYSDTIRRRHVTDMLWYLEQQKALYFSMTMEKGTTEQLHDLYSLIRSITPKPSFHKADAHYFMPEFLGFYWYRKFHKYHLC